MPILAYTRPKLQYWSKKSKETLPDLGLAFVLMLRPFFPELVMSTNLLNFEHPSVLLFCLVTSHRIYLWVFSQLKRSTLNHIIFIIKTLDQMKRNLNHYLNLRRSYDVSVADVTYVRLCALNIVIFPQILKFVSSADHSATTSSPHCFRCL